MSLNPLNTNYKTSIFQMSNGIKREKQNSVAVENSALWLSIVIFFDPILCCLYRQEDRHMQIENWDIIRCFGNDLKKEMATHSSTLA